MKDWLFVLDLDDTLYPERDYALSGFEAVDKYLRRHYELKGFLQKAKTRFERGERGKIFDAVLPELGQPSSPELIATLVEIYRGHKPRLSFYPGAEKLLAQLARLGHLALISDGPLQSQSRKVAALSLRRRFHPVILTESLGKEYAKPSLLAFQLVAEKLKTRPEKSFYIGDNPEKDFLAPNRLGWRTIQIIHPGQVRPFREFPKPQAAQFLVRGFAQLAQVLEKICGCALNAD